MERINEDNDSVRDVPIMWLDNNSLFFVGNYEPAIYEEPLYYGRWLQVEEHINNLEPELVETVPKMPVKIDTYYSTSGAINLHRNQSKDYIEIEQNIRTKDWWKRVNTSTFGMILVDAMNVH